MTKKFWRDWQKRKYATKNIVLHQYLYIEPDTKTECITHNINEILSLDFYDNKVKIEFRTMNEKPPFNIVIVRAIIRRKDIKTITFNKH